MMMVVVVMMMRLEQHELTQADSAADIDSMFGLTVSYCIYCSGLCSYTVAELKMPV